MIAIAIWQEVKSTLISRDKECFTQTGNFNSNFARGFQLPMSHHTTRLKFMRSFEPHGLQQGQLGLWKLLLWRTATMRIIELLGQLWLWILLLWRTATMRIIELLGQLWLWKLLLWRRRLWGSLDYLVWQLWLWKLLLWRRRLWGSLDYLVIGGRGNCFCGDGDYEDHWANWSAGVVEAAFVEMATKSNDPHSHCLHKSRFHNPCWQSSPMILIVAVSTEAVSTTKADQVVQWSS